MTFEILRAVLGDVMSCSMVDIYHHFGGVLVPVYYIAVFLRNVGSSLLFYVVSHSTSDFKLDSAVSENNC
jgi:hypothetical protein